MNDSFDSNGEPGPLPDEDIKALSKLSLEELLAMAEFEPSLREVIEQFEKEQGL